MILMLNFVLFAILRNLLMFFYTKYRKCKQCKIKMVLKRYYGNKDRILQKQRDTYARYKDLDKRLKALEEKIILNDSENQEKKLKNEIYSKGPKKK